MRPCAGFHIGIDASRSYVDRPTGTENYSCHLTDALLGLDSPHRFTLYLRGSTELPQPIVERSAIRRIGPNRLWTHVGLSIEMARRPPDVLFVPAHVLPLYRPRASVVTVHDLGYLFYPETHSRSSWWYLHLSTAFHTRAATRIIADSSVTKRDLVKFYHADAAKISVVHLAAEGSFRPTGSPQSLAAARSRYAGGRPYFLHVGTLQPRKNVGRLLEAYDVLRREVPDAPNLVLAGKRGRKSDQVLNRVAALGLEDTVRFFDFVPQGELPELLSGAVALVFPSLYEGFGLPALEAMACGTPVIAAENSSLPEVVGDAGILVNPHDSEALAQAMTRVATDAALREDLAARSLSRASGFTWGRAAEETLQVLQSAAASSRAR